MSSVLLQKHGGKLRLVAYFSSKLDAVAAGLPHSLNTVAAASIAVLASRGLVGYQKQNILVPHAVSSILLEQRTSHLTPARMLHYHNVLLSLPNVTITRYTVLNPMTNYPQKLMVSNTTVTT